MHSETTAIRERMVPYVLWVQNISVFVFLLLGVSICSLFLYQGVHFVLVITFIKAGLRGHGECDISVTGLRPTSLKHTCMQTSTHTGVGEARMGYKGVYSSSSFKNTQILIGWKSNNDE